MTHIAAALFFTLTLLAAAVVLHMQVRRYWTEILLALRGEWHGVPHYRIVPVTPRPVPRAAFAKVRRRAAF